MCSGIGFIVECLLMVSLLPLSQKPEAIKIFTTTVILSECEESISAN